MALMCISLLQDNRASKRFLKESTVSGCYMLLMCISICWDNHASTLTKNYKRDDTVSDMKSDKDI